MDLASRPRNSRSALVQLVDRTDSTQVRKWQQDAPITWFFESYQLSQPLLAEAQHNSDLDYTYYPKYAPVLEQRLLQAGVRLAGVLNELFA